MSAICNVFAVVAFWSPNNVAVETKCYPTYEACQQYVNHEVKGDPGDRWVGDCIDKSKWPPTTRRMAAIKLGE